ncbi:flagella associated protein 50 [Selaginella moellendorffii]|uniref:Flagella associated protein 50 n=1 Tax=Selaginella moellendorffii TaxID=88036 RepID=D8RWP1_SELML|nr:flagella associated protein 50 [Selaginella moellendorffii]
MATKSKQSFVKLKKIKARMADCRKSQKLVLSGLELEELPQGLVNMIKGAGANVVIEFDFHNNQLTDVIPEISEFRGLRALRLYQNNLHQLPQVVFSFHKLQVLDVSENEIREMDHLVGSLIALRELNFARNYLTSLPTFWKNLGFLLYLNVANNQLTELPESLGTLRHLQRLDVSSNMLSTLPLALQNLKELILLDVHNNRLVHIPPSLSLLKNLQEFNCEANPLAEPANKVYSRGFEEFMEFLRESFSQQQLEELIRQKPQPTIVGSYLQFPTRFESAPGGPPMRSHHSMTEAGPILYMFGGNIPNYGKVDDLYTFDLRTLLWAKPGTSGNAPAPRDGHAAAYDGHKRLYIFGGRNEENKLLNDLHYLDVKSMSWYQPLVEGTVPSIREGASLSVAANQVILFGGRGTRQRHNDLYTLCTQTWSWIPQRTKGSVPAPREHAAVAAIGANIYVHGGKGNVMQDDIYVLDVNSLVWTKLVNEGLCPSPRYDHVATIFDNRLYIAGGIDGNGTALTSAFVLPLGDEVLRQPTSNPAVTVSAEVKRSAHEGSWIELESHITSALQCTICFHASKLIIFKVETLDEIESDTSTETWDMYMETMLESLKPLMVETTMKRSLDTKTDRVLHIIHTKINQMPRSYQVLSQKEQLLLKHVKHLQKRFQQVYPERRPLLLIAKNECGVEKFICSTIRPSHMEYTELYQWQGCASFISNFLAFDTLEDPKYFPSYIPSSQSVIEWQRGDCFDFSIALASLLIGARYDAYCVAGYAPLFLTSNNQKHCECPKAVEERELASRRPPEKPPRTTKYSRPSPPILNDQFLSNEKDIRDAAAKGFAEIFKGSVDAKLKYGQNEEEDTLLRYCVERCNVPDLEEVEPPEPPEPAEAPSTSSSPDPYKTAAEAGTTSTTQEEKSDAKQEGKSDEAKPEPEMKPDDPKPEGAEETPEATECGGVQKQIQDSMVVEAVSAPEPPVEPEVDKLDRKRVHCWVMIVSGKRGLTESFFVEPSTGRKYHLTDSPYYAVEYVWNQSNVWINMQPNPTRAGINNLSWNLKDTVKWERIFDGLDTEGRFRDNLTIVDGKKEEDTSSKPTPSSTPAGSRPDPTRASSPEAATGTISATSGATKETISKISSDKKTVVDEGEKIGETDIHHWLLPPSWVPKLEISMEAFVTRCPKGMKKTHYDKCTHEMYAFYGDYVRWDGLIERLHFYADNDRRILLECHDYFQRRKDGLKRRIFLLQENKVHEFFNQGTSFGLKEIEIVEGVSRKFMFHSGARTDGLVCREELLGKKLVETFDNSESSMVYRCACYGVPAPVTLPQGSPIFRSEPDSASTAATAEPKTKSSSRGSSLRSDSASRTSRARISSDSARGKSLSRTMSRFRRFSKQHPKNVAKKVFRLSQDQIRIDYHHIGRRITSISRVYTKDGTMTLLQVDPFEKELELFERMDEFHELLITEREMIKAVRDGENETRDILQHRLKEEQNVILELPYTDVACFKQDDSLQDREAEKKAPTDYLSPFLPPGTRPRQKLTRVQMLEVRENCLKALKQRLLNRATIIQTRYDEETAALAKRRANFERDREQMTVDEVEKYEQDCETAVFRIRILEKRAKEHEQSALRKYTELDRKLRSDPRLSSLYDGTAIFKTQNDNVLPQRCKQRFVCGEDQTRHRQNSVATLKKTRCLSISYLAL